MRSIEDVKKALNAVGFVGERKALALAGLGFYGTIFLFMGILLGQQPPELAQWAPTFFGLGACYALGFFALAADWFWARWFALGLGSSGVSLVVWAIVMTREAPMALVSFGLVHGLIVAFLSGDPMAARYEGREDWRKRFQIDEQGALKLRRTVTRAATSLPSLIVLALKPRDDGAGMAMAAVASVATLGIVGMLRGRAWGLLAVAAAGIGAITAGVCTPNDVQSAFTGTPLHTAPLALFAGALLLAATAPFVRPVLLFLGVGRVARVYRRR